MLLHQPVDHHAQRRPSASSISAHDYQWTYDDLVKASMQLAAFLLAQSVGVGDRVAILGLNSAVHGAVILACSRIGAVAVPINVRLAPQEIAFILDDAKINVLFVTDTVFEAALPDILRQRTLATTVVGPGSCADISLPELLTTHVTQHTLSAESAPLHGMSSTEQIPVLQLYTSGTTGRPKGAVLSHRNLTSLVTMMALTNDGQYTSRNTDLLIAPLFHIGGSGILFISLATGGHTIMHEAFDPLRAVTTIAEKGVNTAFMVPAMIQAIVKTVPELHTYDFSSLQHIAYGAAPISATLLKEALGIFQCQFSQVYGMTETTGTVVSLTPEDHERALAGEEHLLRACGRPCAGNEVQIIDDQGRVLGPGETGQICLRSASNMQHYFNRPEATAESLQNGWMLTGDAGYIDQEGYLYLRDRIKDMVVTGGENVYPVEVENVLAALPGVIEVAVIGIPDEKFGEALLAVFALKPGQSLDADTMIAFCRDKLAGYKIPRQLTIVDALPRNPSGKMLKTVLREPYWQGQERRIG
jgi:acyl-CoA synthetase (AMP-forming)/AMP-acid ligase II